MKSYKTSGRDTRHTVMAGQSDSGRLNIDNDHLQTQKNGYADIHQSPRTMAQQQLFREVLGESFSAPNTTGMPDELKNGLEQLSGFDMSDVRVHYNSARPAGIGASAYAQEDQIHLGPGQEKHLPHEAWHIVQQKQGRVTPTIRLAGVAVNDNADLEKEAEVMGVKAMQSEIPSHAGPLRSAESPAGQPRQMYMEYLVKIAEYLGVDATVNDVAQKLKISPGFLIAGLLGLGALGVVGLGLGVKWIISYLTGDTTQTDNTPETDNAPQPDNTGIPLHHNVMTQDRGIAEYKWALHNPGNGLKETLPLLNQNDTWVDMGTGKGKALKDVYDSLQQNAPKMIGVLAEKPEGFLLDDDQIDKTRLDYSEAFLDDIPDDRFGGPGAVSLITDYSGVATYTKDLGGTIARYMRLLKPGGKAIIRIQNTSGKQGWSEVFTLNKFTRKSNGEEISPADWLSQGSGFGVTCFKGPHSISWILTLTRNTDEIWIPPIELNKYDHKNQPPLREFIVG